MTASTAVTAVQFVLMMTTCASLAMVSEGEFPAVRRHGHAEFCQPNSKVVAPALCEVCDRMPDHLVADCCRWCFAEKTSLQRDNEDELGADKRVKYFLGKRPKYFLGK